MTDLSDLGSSGVAATGAATDRELLELAAKAAGIAKPFQVLRNGTWVFDEPRVKNWNPLTDDGDALRLAVKLNLRIENFGDVVQVVQSIGGGEPIEISTGLSGADPYAATRRAIVRAAAEIGKSSGSQADTNG